MSFIQCTVHKPKGLLEVNKYHLDPEEFVRIIALKMKAIVAVQMFPQQLHDCVDNHLNYIALFNQLSGLITQTGKISIIQEYFHIVFNFSFLILSYETRCFTMKSVCTCMMKQKCYYILCILFITRVGTVKICTDKAVTEMFRSWSSLMKSSCNCL